MKNKKILWSLLLALCTVSGLFANTPGSTAVAIEATISNTNDTASEESQSISDFIQLAVTNTLNAHSEEISCEDFAFQESEIIAEMWIGHLLSAGLGVKKIIDDNGAQSIAVYMGANLTMLPQKISESAQEQNKVLQDIIIESLDAAEVLLTTEKKEELAALMATEIITETLYRYSKSLQGPSVIDIAMHEGYKGMQNLIKEINKLNNQFTLISLVQAQNIKNIKVKLRSVNAEYPLSVKKLEDALEATQEYKDYIDSIRTILSIKVNLLSGIDWAANSRWTWAFRFAAKNSAKLAYRGYKLVA
ncbi:hypothetical protein HOM50_00650 [bacterium]|jgi:hypothetical protein|nr:hypothetical protein [bacterium]MBT5014900.1 hypothetical protein [bacterium]